MGGALLALLAAPAHTYPPPPFLPRVELLLGDPAKAARLLGWRPKVLFEALVKEMVEADIALVKAGDMSS